MVCVCSIGRLERTIYPRIHACIRIIVPSASIYFRHVPCDSTMHRLAYAVGYAPPIYATHVVGDGGDPVVKISPVFLTLATWAVFDHVNEQ